MKRTQNEKILQIKFETLVVGIDIGKETHYARAFDCRGLELSKLLKFSNTNQGYEALEDWMQTVMKEHSKTEAIVGFEPTGHYWFTLGDHLQRKGHRLGIVNPFHVKCTRELDDNSQTKNDKKDPKTIAMLVKDGRFRDVYIPEDVYQELREAVSERERLLEQLIGLSNQVIRWLDIRFPEFNEVFKDWTGDAAWLTLKNYPTPAKILSAGAPAIVGTWSKEMKKPSIKRAEKLVRLANVSIGRTAGSEAAEAALQNLLTQYEMILKQKQDTERLMQELLMKVPNASKLVDIKGIGMVAAAVIVSEIGDISRFKDPRQIQKMAGLSLRENSSGKHKGKTTISKRGRKRLREGLFRAIITILATNQEFRMLHQKNLGREKNPLNKMESIIALCGKLIRVIFAILTKGSDYDAGKMIEDMKASMKAA
ncbi:IS110 family transposase [Ruminiclostridium cellulolyticum]|uniref:Transposase IS116/IS110/IS902 family protein n=1 Tax=Ruminiclostridium cellulolyticum (strain ATCC 35319 / DSM 5812 / JCM 6584 / H10) TaxID=394503 RepID=B8I270_RUMCH|nr:IS110 family transposase [Ruminiclostridium cellulolyticum]ACL75896.1 transposase IS116/IS110/IS902 family protein [Ruminiclostridium cellulolyticum H10]